MTECEHIYGFEKGYYWGDEYQDAQLVDHHSSDTDTIFKYCPLCGIELKEEEKE